MTDRVLCVLSHEVDVCLSCVCPTVHPDARVVRSLPLHGSGLSEWSAGKQCDVVSLLSPV